MKKLFFRDLVVLLTLILCILNGLGVINIPWLWCFGLLWIPSVVIFAGIVFLLIAYIILELFNLFD